MCRWKEGAGRRSGSTGTAAFRACAIVASMPLMAWSTGKDASCPGRLAHPFGSGKHGQIQGIKGDGLDMMDKEGG